MARPKENSRRGRSQARNNPSARANVPDVYKEMLIDTISSPTQVNDEGKIIKRRRVAGQIVSQSQGITDDLDDESSLPSGIDQPDDLRNPKSAIQQTAYNDSEDSAESDLDWEEINLKGSLDEGFSSNHLDNETNELTLVLDEDGGKTRGKERIRRAPVTAAERQLRFETHKIHLLSLLVHIHIRNHWCNDERVHGALTPLLPNRTLSYLNPDEKHSQFQRSRSFIDGLRQASETFRERFKISSRGMSRSTWAESSEALAHIRLPEDLELPIEKSDFCAAANKLEASRDVGAQIFCALLRSAGVETRLVCSLQPLPFNVTGIPATSSNKEPTISISRANALASASGDESHDDAGESNSDSVRKPSESNKPRRILSGIQMRTTQTPEKGSSGYTGITPPRVHTKRIKESLYPVFWTEAFNEADQKWIPVDPIVTKTVSKPSSFEPPASDIQNSLTYVLAFESDGSAHDVTRRYAKAFNAKTRRGRLEIIPGGDRWWRRILKRYTRAYDLPRDQIETSELVAKEAAEPMPKNVLDFKNHPYYALERHLRRSEVIHPKREAGKVAVGRSGGKQILEQVFRRRDVQVVKSGDSWYRLGREVKIGEQPLKHVPTRKGKDLVKEHNDSREEDDAGTALYAFHQTIQYSAPPVVNGRIPKNVYGNLDVYVSSMIPEGGCHIRHPDTSRAARILGVDFSDAVTGFSFKGRHGTAVITGAVVAESCRDAVEEVIGAFEIERQEEEEEGRILEALRTWKKFLVGLRIRQRIQGYEIEGERKIEDEAMGNGEESEDDDEGGGFIPDRERTELSKTLSSSNIDRTHDTSDDSDDGGGGFLLSDELDHKDGATTDKSRLNNFNKASLQSDYQIRQGSFRHENLDESIIAGVNENNYKAEQVESPLQRADRTELLGITNIDAPHLEPASSTFESDKLQAPTKQHSQPQQKTGRVVKTSRTQARSSQNESSRAISANYSSHPIDTDLPPSPTKPYLPDAEMAEALVLQQIHDSHSPKEAPESLPSPNHHESNLKTSHPTSTSSSHQEKSASSSPTRNATLPIPSPPPPTRTTTQDPCPPPTNHENLENIKNAQPGSRSSSSSSSSLKQGEEEEEDQQSENTKNMTHDQDDDNNDGDESEDAGSLLSRDPSDEDADPSWLDY